MLVLKSCFLFHIPGLILAYKFHASGREDADVRMLGSGLV